MACSQAFLSRIRLEKVINGKQVALDQLTYGPLCNILMISYLSLVVEGRSPTATSKRLRRDYPAIQLNGWKLWCAPRADAV